MPDDPEKPKVSLISPRLYNEAFKWLEVAGVKAIEGGAHGIQLEFPNHSIEHVVSQLANALVAAYLQLIAAEVEAQKTADALRARQYDDERPPTR